MSSLIYFLFVDRNGLRTQKMYYRCSYSLSGMKITIKGMKFKKIIAKLPLFSVGTWSGHTYLLKTLWNVINGIVLAVEGNKYISYIYA